MKNRKYGILMPVSSLPSKEVIGTLGDGAYRFVDYLSNSGAAVWQVLPLNPTNYGDSPYQSCSSDALNYYFIDLNYLADDGLLTVEEVKEAERVENRRRVDYGRLYTEKIALLKKAYSRFKGGEQFERFVNENRYYDFAVFMAIKAANGHRAWTEWQDLKEYDGQKVERFVRENKDEVLFWQFTQFIFLKQWNALKSYANSHGVSIMGDIPLYVAYDSAEVWKYGGALFKTDENRNLKCVAGCPPDGFTEEGQLWGNPVYDWEKMRADGYKWWRERIDKCFSLFDILRIDHFRGFDRYWEVPAGEKTAKGGSWQDGPKEELFKGMESYNIVAEDLGVIDDGVRRLMKNVGYPGMKVLTFAFDGREDNEHKPSNCTENFVSYTGTHDNMPLTQYIKDLSDEWSVLYFEDLEKECGLAGVEADLTSAENACKTVIKLAFYSKANTVIIPMCDILAQGKEARMNLPSTVSDKNWSWRYVEEDFKEEISANLFNLAQKSGRIN